VKNPPPFAKKPPAPPGSPPVRVPLLDCRHQIEAVLVVRGPWAELLGEGAQITIRVAEGSE
jgi:hypothetical protein